MLLDGVNNVFPKATTFTTDITTVKGWFTPMLIAGIIIFAGIIIQRLIILYIKRIAKKTNWKGCLVLISSLRGMVILISILFGVYYGMAAAPIDPQTILLEHRFHSVFVIFIITFV